ncbi:MAG: LptF/LptG family permease [Akkermansiaceae bacterium]|nr:LptF/LptG family permease [Akkermansiaceae bacterium]
MSNLPRWLLPLLLLVLGVMAATYFGHKEQLAVDEQFIGFPDSHIASNLLRPWILGFLCLMPAIAAIAYSLGTTFDRYLSRQFMTIFGICLASLFGIYMLFDLNDNLGDFDGSKNVALSVPSFYLHRLPAILLILLPYTLLLSLIHGLGKFSKSNEIIAMIQSGSSIVRVSAPLIFAGLWCSFFLLGLNYHWAPHAEGRKNEMIAEAKGLPIYVQKNVLFRDPDSRRLWLVGAFPADFQKGVPLENVEVTTLNEDSTLLRRVSSPSASWDKTTRDWTFENPLITRFEEGESPVFEQMDEPLVRRQWNETPSQIIKPGLDVYYLGIPELSTWLASRLSTQALSNRASYVTHWHYRWALPMSCIITVLIAAPLSIHFARRGAGSGIFLAVLLAVVMLFVNSVTLALGESNIVYPPLAAWLPNIGFTLLGLWLYHRRVAGRPIYQTIKRLITVNN